MKSLYSIIIATKNNETTIKYVLKSTLLLAKNFDVELVVVDGNSTDRTFNIVKHFVEVNKSYYISLKILRDPGSSLSLARHLGFKNSMGEIIIFLDGDTLFTNNFKYYLESELKGYDLITPIFEIVALDRATETFNKFIKVVMNVAHMQRDSFINVESFKNQSFHPPAARIYRREVLERTRGYPLSSRFFCEDRLATAIAVRLGFRHKFSWKLKLLKIDEPSYIAYWKKHYRYGQGIHKDLSNLGKQLLKGYILLRRLNHINVVLPVLSLIYAFIQYRYSKNLKEAMDVALMKYFIDMAMLYGDLVGSLTK